MRKIILIRDNTLDNQNYLKVIIPCNEKKFENADSITSFHDVEKSNDVSELIINQILASAISDIASTNVYIVSSNNLISRTNIYSAHTIRYFVNRGKESGDIFLYTGGDKSSELIASSWGFRQLKLS